MSDETIAASDPQASRGWRLGWAGVSALALLAGALLAACGGSDDAPPSEVSATIGAAGGTLDGPDGARVVIPPGALARDTLIAIARSDKGGPAGGPAGYERNGATYEFTPHDIAFAQPVSIRIPATSPPQAGVNEVFRASLDDAWQSIGSPVGGGFAEWQSPSFSWYTFWACAIPVPSPDPYPCQMPLGITNITTVPADALTLLWASAQQARREFSVRVATTLQLTAAYTAPPDCADARIKFQRRRPGDAKIQVLSEGPVAVTTSADGFSIKATSSYTVDLTDADPPGTFIQSQFSCRRAYQPPAYANLPPDQQREGATDTMRFDAQIPPAPPSPKHTVGGSVSGLGGAGLVLQNNGGDNLAVAADGPFTFAMAINRGAAFNVSVLTQPAGQACTVQNGSGSAAADVSNVLVSCITPVNQPLKGLAIAAGFQNSLVVANDGTVWAWGNLVDPVSGGFKATGPWAARPVQVQGLTGVSSVALAAESQAFYALHKDGTVSAWGRNEVGQLGDRSTTDRPMPVKVLQDASTPMDEVCAIAASNHILVMARQTGCSPGQRDIDFGPWIAGLFQGTSIGGANAAGLPFNGAIARLVQGWPVGRSAGEAVGTLSASHGANDRGAVYIRTGRGVQYVWGDNASNRLGAGAAVAFAEKAGGPVAADVAVVGLFGFEVGASFAIGITETRTLVAIGRNLEGQLGDGTDISRPTPVDVLGLAAVSGLSAGQTNAAAITKGELWAWGTLGTAYAHMQPTRLGTGTGFTKVAMGDTHGLAIGPNGEVHSWGEPSGGALGDGTTSGPIRSAPTVVIRP